MAGMVEQAFIERWFIGMLKLSQPEPMSVITLPDCWGRDFPKEPIETLHLAMESLTARNIITSFKTGFWQLKSSSV